MRGRIQNLFTNRLFLFYFIYIGAILLSIPFSLWPGGSAIFLVDVVLKEAVILFAILVAIKNERQLILIFKLIVYCTTVVAVFTIVKYAGGQNLLAGYRASL